MDDRARITIPDVMYVLASVAFLGVLFPVYAAALDDRADLLSTGEGYIFQLLLPLLVLVLLSMIWRAAVGGGPT